MERFLDIAMRILDIGSTETIQQLIRELATDRGLNRIKQAMEAEFVLGYSPSNLSFRRHCFPLLRILAHEEFRASLVLESEVGTVFNFVYGPGGRRGTFFFGQVAQNLTGAADSGERELVENTLHTASVALFNTLNLNHAAAIQDGFKAIVLQLNELLVRIGPEPYASNTNATFLFRSAQHVIDRIKILLKIADALPTAALRKPAAVVGASIDVHQIDFPGELSREGPRHDNDHADVSRIKILPTSEEINSHRNEFLPQRSLAYPHHLEGISRVLDFQFRLLREDTSGQIREAVRTVIHMWDELVAVTKGGKNATKLKSQTHNVRTLVYQNTKFETVRCTNRDGIIFTASFDQPAKVQALKETARREWWERARYLAVGSLLCLVDSHKRATFLVVCERKVIAADYKRQNKGNEAEVNANDDLASDPRRARITLRFAQEMAREDVESIFLSTALQVLVEFPGLLFASFDPILKSLQQISKDGNVPFTNWLAPSPTLTYAPDPNARQNVEVPPPLYMTKPGATLKLDSITNGTPISYSIGCDLSARQLEEATPLDHGQCEALLASFSKELALIQGPPGTGKSYLGVQLVKVLLANRETTGIGPIICVCYTNHALDQFLEHLIDDGIEKIVRVGSRSKSDRVQDKSLYLKAQLEEQTKPERISMLKAKGEIMEIERSITAACNQLYEPASPAALKTFLQEAYSVAFMDIFGGDMEDEDGFRTVRRKRQCLFEYWSDELKEKATQDLVSAAEDHTKERQTLSRQQNELERRCLEKSHVIGLTTTGLARHADLIRSLKAKVLICEEAAEVLEAHILTALLPKLEHAILVGDHLQLRPQIMKHEFSIENPKGGQAYGLNTSLFERLVEVEWFGGKRFPIAKLDTQRRMYPSIANLVRNTLYPDLRDHPSTEAHPEVPGMAKRLFWMDHRHLEASEDKLELIQTSHANEFEADIVVGLVRHLSRQGTYKSGEIAVLVPYLRQLFILRRKLAATFEKGALLSEVRVATVDNFQGEEAKIIIISLVRSNQRNKCGFLKTSNRINVLLSRARDGMYIIGNAETCGQVDMWKKVITMFEKGNSIDKHLQLCCARHPQKPIFVSQPEDFHMLSPEGGCNERCQWRLQCGHPCFKKCHSDLLHESTLCLEPCNRTFKHCDHTCPKICGEPCLTCQVEVPGVQLPCGHTPSKLRCHQLQELNQVRCTELMGRKLDVCGHETTMQCGEDPKAYVCRRMCEGKLPCGHKCKSVCSSCTRRSGDGTGKTTTHGPCRIVCGRNYSTCPHSCEDFCHGDAKCAPCSQPCAIRCDHSVCGKLCREPCAPCPERCTWGCKHRKRCDMPCAVPCNINPCSERCDQQLDCGHQCPSVCGETCPPAHFCQECAAPALLGRQVDLITLETYAEIDLDLDPIIVPKCGHFYVMSTYDRHMGMENAYRMTADGRILGPRALDGSEARENLDPDEPAERLVVRACPDCRAPLRDLHRYNRIVKVAYLDESTRRFCTIAQANYLKLYKEVSTAQNRLEAERSQFLYRLSNNSKRSIAEDRLPKPVEERIQGAHVLLNKIWEFAWTVVEEEQPYVRVRDIVISKRRREQTESAIPGSARGGSTSTAYVMDSSVVQLGFRLKAYSLFNEFRWDALWDLHSIAESDKTDEATQRKLRRRIISEIPRAYDLCSDLINDCQQANLGKYEVEARVCRARFVALFRIISVALNVLLETPAAGSAATDQRQRQQAIGEPHFTSEEGIEQEQQSLNRCDDLCAQLPGTVGPMQAKIDEAKKFLGGMTFYSPVSAAEKEAVYKVMAREFISTGRWYTCRNGHPFTIGDCGAPRQLASCPECGEGIGGGYNGLASGVSHANDFTELDQRFNRMRF
ncbi:hypothetical protein EV426DRAFT_566793 [Tirmania nivea]|nr:hypothetical protein EV426DRAFT_566793 [Tirmania nivea]